jgi:hypothetical protein
MRASSFVVLGQLKVKALAYFQPGLLRTFHSGASHTKIGTSNTHRPSL